MKCECWPVAVGLEEDVVEDGEWNPECPLHGTEAQAAKREIKDCCGGRNINCGGHYGRG